MLNICTLVTTCIFLLFQTQNLEEATAVEYWLCSMFVIGNIINSKRRVRLPKFKDFCHNAYKHFKKYFGWCYIPNHGMYYCYKINAIAIFHTVLLLLLHSVEKRKIHCHTIFFRQINLQ